MPTAPKSNVVPLRDVPEEYLLMAAATMKEMGRIDNESAAMKDRVELERFYNDGFVPQDPAEVLGPDNEWLIDDSLSGEIESTTGHRLKRRT